MGRVQLLGRVMAHSRLDASKCRMHFNHQECCELLLHCMLVVLGGGAGTKQSILMCRKKSLEQCLEECLHGLYLECLATAH
jgi:hypothetical protein